MELKTLPQYTRAAADDPRTIIGIFAVLGNVDSYHDRLWPGCFQKTIVEQRRKIRHLWQHDFGAPPIAQVVDLREVTREELPTEVLREAPEATGGLEVTRRYLDTPRGNEVLLALQAGALNEGSFGFDPVKFAFTRESEDPLVWPTREVYELRLWDTSDVNWGGNEATVSVRTLRLSLDDLLYQFEQRLAEGERFPTKAGARHSAADTKLLNQIHKAVVTLGTTQCKGLMEDDDPAEDAGDKDEASKDEKSRAVDETLTSLRDQLAFLEMEIAF